MCDCPKERIYVNKEQKIGTPLKKMICITYTVVQLRYSPVCNRKPRIKHKVDEGVNVALFSEVQPESALAAIPRFFKVVNHVPKQRQGSQNADLLSTENQQLACT